MSAGSYNLGPMDAHGVPPEGAGALYTLKSDGSTAGVPFPEDGGRGVSDIEMNLFCVQSYGAPSQQDLICYGGDTTRPGGLAL